MNQNNIEYYTFPCGCKLPIVGEKLPNHELPRLNIDFYKVPLTCPATWKMICDGKTQGLFQIETNLGKKWAKEIKPENIEHLAAIGAVLRPGALKSITDGKSMTKHYSDRKNKLEEIVSYHPVVDECLKETYGCLVYQEQAMALCRAVANFTLGEAELARKAIGKKIASEMAKVKAMFKEKAKEAGIVNDYQAEEIIGWIEKSQRYSFNKCLSPNTIVETTTGYKTLEELKIGEKVNSPDGFIDVTDKIDTGKQEVYEIVLESDKSIVCTLEHKFLCDDGIIRELSEILILDCGIVCDGENTQSEKIKSIKKIGIIPTLDITVNSKNHIYYANGIATSNSHAAAYGITTYWSAYAKAHSPINFFCAWLQDSIGQADGEEDVKKLADDCQNFNIKINTPSLLRREQNFNRDGKELHFGMLNIKKVGESVLRHLEEIIEISEKQLNIKIDKFSWLDILIYIGYNCKKDAFINLILSGALSHLQHPRLQMKYEYEQLNKLNDKEIAGLKEVLVKNGDSGKIQLVDAIRLIAKTKKDGGYVSNVKRLELVLEVIKSLENPPYDLNDIPSKIREIEERILGVPITYSIQDSIDNDMANTTCKNINNGECPNNVIIGVEIKDVKPYTMKNNKKMWYVTASDGTANLESIAMFPEQIEEFGVLVTKGNTVMIFGEYQSKFRNISVKKVVQA